MKHTTQRPNKSSGYTLAELMVALAVFGVAAGMILQLQTLSANLYSRNTAVNLPLRELTVAVDRLNRDIHGAISLPTLIDSDLTPHTGLDGAAGVSFLLPAGTTPLTSTYKVTSNAAAGQNVVQVYTGTFIPAVGQRLLVPTHGLEADITAVTYVSGTLSPPSNLVYNLMLAANVPTTITQNNGSTTYNIIAYIAKVAAYVTVHPNNAYCGELRYYDNVANNSYSVLARNITSEAPFNMPVY